jgi:hypothetical protein
MAVRRPDLIAGIVTLGSPLTDSLDIHPLVRMQVRVVATLGGLGLGGLFGRDCLEGDCCKDFWQELHGAFPDDVGFVSVYSKSDGVVRWSSCLDEYASHVEVGASHCGMAANPGVYRAIATALEGFRRDERKRVAAGDIIPPRIARAA